MSERSSRRTLRSSMQRSRSSLTIPCCGFYLPRKNEKSPCPNCVCRAALLPVRHSGGWLVKQAAAHYRHLCDSKSAESTERGNRSWRGEFDQQPQRWDAAETSPLQKTLLAAFYHRSTLTRAGASPTADLRLVRQADL